MAERGTLLVEDAENQIQYFALGTLIYKLKICWFLSNKE
jgi:hypothetical protein